MQLDIEVWLRGNDFATNDIVDLPLPEPAAWQDEHIGRLLEEMLRAIERAANPDADRGRPVTLRGFSWIVTPFADRGVLISVEIQLGAAAAGPFPVEQATLDAAITRVLAQARSSAGDAASRVH
jgi:hypothetical protein